MAEKPPWPAIQPPKLPRFTDWRGGWLWRGWTHPGGRAHPPQLQDGGRHSCRMDHPGAGWICPEGGAHPRSRGGRHSGPKFWQSSQPPSATTGASALLTSLHGRRQGMGESVVGYAQPPADADHQAERSASGRRQPRYALQPFYGRAAPPIPPSRHSSLRQGARWRHLPSGTGWGSALDAEDADVEVRAEQVLVAQPQHSKKVEELRAQVAALTAKTAELQAELRHQSTRAPRPKICHWWEQPGHFQRDCIERRQYAQRQQGPRASFKPSCPQPRFYAPRHSAGPRFPSHQGN